MRHSQAIALGPGGWDKEDMKGDCRTAWPAHPQDKRPWERLADNTAAPWSKTWQQRSQIDEILDPWRQSRHALVEEVRSARRDKHTASRRHRPNRAGSQSVRND